MCARTCVCLSSSKQAHVVGLIPVPNCCCCDAAAATTPPRRVSVAGRQYRHVTVKVFVRVPNANEFAHKTNAETDMLHSNVTHIQTYKYSIEEMPEHIGLAANGTWGGRPKEKCNKFEINRFGISNTSLSYTQTGSTSTSTHMLSFRCVSVPCVCVCWEYAVCLFVRELATNSKRTHAVRCCYLMPRAKRFKDFAVGMVRTRCNASMCVCVRTVHKFHIWYLLHLQQTVCLTFFSYAKKKK